MDIDLKSSGPRWAPKVVVLLDEQARVLNVNRSLAGASFDFISTGKQQKLHRCLHPDCDGRCRFDKMWRKAWGSLSERDSIEWEVDDQEISRLLRLTLSTPPTPDDVASERRRHRLLTITDVTKYRREHQLVLDQQQALIRHLVAKGTPDAEESGIVYEDTGNTGNHLVAGIFKDHYSFARQLVLAQESERKRIAAELHDGVAQSISMIKYQIEANVARLEGQFPDQDLSAFDRVIDDIKGLVEEIRRISNNLAPSTLEDFGITVGLQWLCKEFKTRNRDVRCNFSGSVGEAETPELVKIAMYRVVQEALHNVAKYSQASRVDVSVSTTDDGVSLTISDDGIGFDVNATSRDPHGQSGFGLRSMRERVEATGGQFSLESMPKNGTLICAYWSDTELDLIR